VRPRSIPNESVPGAGLPQWERFQRFAALIARVPKEEADKVASKRIRKPKGKNSSGRKD